MAEFSVVIICKNEEHIIEKVLQSVVPLSNDIVVYDTGSTDSSIERIKQFPVRLICGEWLGYGKTKQAAVGMAKHNWVLSLDADEAPDAELQQHLQQTQFTDEKTVYRFRFKNFFGDKCLRFGEWGGDRHIRLFNKKHVNWNNAAIHESLMIPKNFRVVNLPGYVLHYTMKDLDEYSKKMVHYALLNAEKYHRAGKKAQWYKLWLSPCFGFIKHYFFQLGFLDGWQGLASARMTAFYSFLKYARLRELNSSSKE